MLNRVIGVAGFKNSGKTTLVEKLVRELTGKGYRVSTVKHAHHSFDIDHEGRDSFRHRKAGASEVAVISRDRTALIHELKGAEPPTLGDVLASLQPCDLVLVEGYKRDSHDKIEVRNLSLSHPELAGEDPTVVAIAANGVVTKTSVPVFERDDVTGLAGFIIRHCRLEEKIPTLRRAGEADAREVRALTRSVYAKWVPTIGREPRPMTADYAMAVREHWIDLVEQAGEILALIETVPKADHLLVENIAIAETWQGRGLGRGLVDHALMLARKAGLQQVRLYTNKAFTSNLGFYLKMGFSVENETLLPDGGTMVHFVRSVS